MAATSFTVVSGTQITAVSPAQAAASYDITVTTAAGTSPVVSADSYTYQAATGPPGTLLVSTSTTDSGGSVVGNGTVLTVGFNEVPVLSGSYSLTLTDGSHVVTLSSAAGTLSGVATGTSVAFTVHGATSLALSELEVLASSGVSDGSGNAWNLVASGQVDEASSCVNIAGFTRVFRGSNCQIGGPVPPAVFDVIALPTADLPGPPDDNAPEVITNCQAGSTDTAYDLNSGAALGANPCGHNPNETAIGNTNSNTLDYIPTPNLASFEEVGVIETIPGSTYVSATSVPVAAERHHGQRQQGDVHLRRAGRLPGRQHRPGHDLAVHLRDAVQQSQPQRPGVRVRDLLPAERGCDVDHGDLAQHDPRQLRPALQVRGLRRRPFHRRSSRHAPRRRTRGVPERVRRTERARPALSSRAGFNPCPAGQVRAPGRRLVRSSALPARNRGRIAGRR